MQDKATHRAILSLVLNAHPRALTTTDLDREINAGSAAGRAVRDLARIGLLDCCDALVRPTAAAVHFDSLEL